MNTSLFNGLNKQQTEAAECVNGPSIILAGAGSGKTRVLTFKVLNLIKNHGVKPSEILMVTFTNKAAAEMKARVKEHLGFMGTFHSLGVRILRHHAQAAGLQNNFVIYDSDDQEHLIVEVLKKLAIDKKYTPSFFLNKISQAKDQMITSDKYIQLFHDYISTLVGSVYQQYQQMLTKSNAVDFDDLLVKTVELFMEHKDILEYYNETFKYILVDEFQDTNYAQYMLTRYLGNKYENVTIVGDFCQSIYSWRGAEIKNLQKFEEDFPKTKVFHLEQNYRSTQSILNFAYDVISKNETHPILQLFTDNSAGEEVLVKELENEEYEALYVAGEIEKLSKRAGTYDTTAVLYRMNAQSRILEEALLSMGIPYTLVGGTRFYERREIKDVICYVRLILNPDDEVSFNRIVKLGKRKYESFKKIAAEIADKAALLSTSELIDEVLQKTDYLSQYNEDIPEDLARLENIKELRSVAVNFPLVSEFLEQVALVESEYSENEKKKRGEKGVTLMTLHQAKGLEFDYVFLIGVEDGILPHTRSVDDLYQLEEERRLLYVGITRARERLYLTYVRRRFMFGRRIYTHISRFLSDNNEYETPSRTW
jgi:DNA helicase-2/ATP-dependent DNA helicase PcrA